MVSFIDLHRGEYGVEPICRVRQIAPSTYYAQRARDADPSLRSERAKRDELLVVLDRLNAHHTAAELLDADHLDCPPESAYRFEWLPAYAPELNPVEHAWGHTKHDDLANYIPESTDVLADQIDTSLGRTSTDQLLLRGFFRLSQLDL